MASPIRFYFDFASPYAYFSLDRIERVAAEHGRTVEWTPILMWVVLKAHGIAPPMDVPVKRTYFLHDMMRSAQFYGLGYRPPVKLPLSSHLAARAFYVLAADDAERARDFAHAVFAAFFREHEDISQESVILRLAEAHGMSAEAARAAIGGPEGRALLEAGVTRAIADKVCGSPYFVVDGEGFFGADRLPQLAWRLTPDGQAVRLNRGTEEVG